MRTDECRQTIDTDGPRTDDRHIRQIDRAGVAWVTDTTKVTSIDREIEMLVDSFELLTGRHLNPDTGQILSTPLLIVKVHPDGPPSSEGIGEVWVHFTDEPHPNVGDVSGGYIDLYVSIAETQTWWQILSNGSCFMWADFSNTLGVVGTGLMNLQLSADKDRFAAVRERMERPVNTPN